MEVIKSFQLETLAGNYPGRMSASAIVKDIRDSLNPDDYCIKGSELNQALVNYAEQHIEVSELIFAIYSHNLHTSIFIFK